MHNINLYIDNKLIAMIGFDIGRIILLCYTHYAKPDACMILFGIKQR